MLLDLLLGGLLVSMIAMGAWRGAVVSGSGVVGLICGYAGGVFAAMHLGDWVAQTLVVTPLVAPAVAGTIGFVVAWLIVSSICDVAVAWDRERVEEEGGRGVFDRLLGGVFGIARGSLLVVLLATLMTWLDAARDLGAVDGLGALPQTEASAMAAGSGRLIEAAVSSALSDSGMAGEVAARITANPGATLGSVQSILSDERLSLLFQDKFFWTLIQNDSIDYAMNRNAIRSIVVDEEMRGRFADLGLVEEAAREDRTLFRQTLAGVLKKIAPRIADLHTDPELHALASDPEILQLLEEGDTFSLISHPKLKRIVDRVSKDL